jgi:hypothetical protein
MYNSGKKDSIYNRKKKSDRIVYPRLMTVVMLTKNLLKKNGFSYLWALVYNLSCFLFNTRG